MKTLFKISTLLIVVLLLFNCHGAKYKYSFESNNYGVDFRDGKWALNEIETSYLIKDKLEEKAFIFFEEYLGRQLVLSKNNKDIFLPFIPVNPDKLKLQKIKQETGLDFVINIVTEKGRNDMNVVQIGDINSKKSNVAKLTLEIYDLNTLEISNHYEITGDVTVENSNRDLSFATSQDQILIKGLKKILKKIKKKSLISK